MDKKKRKTGMIKVRGGFSDLFGISPYKAKIQVNEFDDITRVSFSNGLFKIFEKSLGEPFGFFYGDNNYGDMFCKDLLDSVFHKRNTLEEGYIYNWRRVYDNIHQVIEEACYNEVLDIIEFSCRWIDNRAIPQYKGEVYNHFNSIFENESVGYRFICGRITPITEESEIKAIEEACCNPYHGCRKQLQNAVYFLSDRNRKDYKNCIKESNSAVEAICQIIVGNKHATLSDALKKLESRGTNIHPALKQGFQKIYAFTSDQGGIRHAEGMFESDVSFEEAKFMLVSCSAFVNYLIAESGKGSN